MSSEPESFLARWSRRKRAVEREAEPSVETAAPPVAEDLTTETGVKADAASVTGPARAPSSETGDTAEVPLPPIESLEGLRSDYTAFFQQPVPEHLRRAALMKLFADPHFNQMDMLDVYVDDYTQFEPLPSAMRMRLPSARAFLHGSELAEVEAAEAAAAANESESLAAGTGKGQDHAASPDAAEESSPLSVEDAKIESTTTLTAGPSKTPAESASAEVQDKALNASSTAIPPGNPAASDPSSP